MIRKLKSKKIISLGLLVFTTLLIGLSYGLFTVSTSKYNATNLLVSNLNYVLTIKEDGNTSNILDRTVTVPSNTLAYFNITITSINKIDSKYNLAYKTNSNALVEYTDRTSWTSTGVIESYNDMVYTRKVRVVIDNSKNESSSQVEFGVFGGYSFNTISSIDLGNGFLTVGGPYKELSSVTSKRLVDIIKSDTECVTETNCLYGGGSLNNYLQYPTSENKNENIWRIAGAYNIDNSVVAKIVGDIHSQTTVNEISNSLNLFYNTLDRKDIIYKTNKFNCSETGCNESSYNNIGLISTYEYNEIGGINSYLANTNSFFSLNNANIENITQSGVEETNNTTTSGIRPVIYLDTNIKVTGSGTLTDPYRISEQSDINLIAYTLDGSPTDKTYEWLLQNKAVSKVTCEKGTKATWNYENNSITLTDIVTPDYCTIDFKDGYLVTVTAENGTVTPSSVMVGYGGNVSFTLKPNSGYKYLSNTCGRTVNGNVMTISNITGKKSCKVIFGKTLTDAIHAEYGTPTSGRTDFSVIDNGTPKLYKGTDDQGTTYYFSGDGSGMNNWVKFADKWWRIIRINGNGSVRLLYAGDGKEGIEENNYNGVGSTGKSAYNSTKDHPQYVGWKYTAGDSLSRNRQNGTKSTIYEVVETWYNGLSTANKNYIDTNAIYCNDRNLASGNSYSTSSTFFYAVRERIVDNKAPVLTCSNTSDRFTIFGLMTADEVLYAGGVNGKGSSKAYYYLAKDGTSSITGSARWWTMTPYYFYQSDPSKSVWGCFVYGFNTTLPGNLSLGDVDLSGVVRPVVSLKSNALVSGKGSADDPYVLQGLQ